MTKKKKIKQIIYKKKDYSKLLPSLDKNSNKYSRGLCLTAAGSKKYPGAALLCSRAAQRLGSGYTLLYTIQQNVARSAFAMPSCVCFPFSEFKEDKLLKLIYKKESSILIGPGFIPGNRYSTERFKTALKIYDSRLIVDGGALSSFFSSDIRALFDIRRQNKCTTVLTPHMGEAVKILQCYGVDLDAKNKLKIAKKINQLTGAIVVLKGPDTYICDSKQYTVIKNGGPELAKAGSGDVLAGIIAGLLAQKIDSVFGSCALATYLHARSGKISAKYKTIHSVLPEDLIDNVSLAIKELI